MRQTIPHLYLLAVEDGLAASFVRAFAGVENATIVREDFATFMTAHPEVEGIVSPANSYGMLTGGLDKALKRFFGEALQEAVRHRILTEWFGEQTVGTSMVVDIPDFPGKKLLHTPTMRKPEAIRDHQVVYLCMRSALMAALRADISALVVPAFGAGTGGLPTDTIARDIRAAYDQISGQLAQPHLETFRTGMKI